MNGFVTSLFLQLQHGELLGLYVLLEPCENRRGLGHGMCSVVISYSCTVSTARVIRNILQHGFVYVSVLGKLSQSLIHAVAFARTHSDHSARVHVHVPPILSMNCKETRKETQNWAITNNMLKWLTALHRDLASAMCMLDIAGRRERKKKQESPPPPAEAIALTARMLAAVHR